MLFSHALSVNCSSQQKAGNLLTGNAFLLAVFDQLPGAVPARKLCGGFSYVQYSSDLQENTPVLEVVWSHNDDLSFEISFEG